MRWLFYSEMFWTDETAQAIRERFAEKIARDEELIVRDEKTCSGRVHIGSLRGVAIHGAIAEQLNAAGVKAKFLFEINDFDPMDDCPPYLDKSFLAHMGKPLFAVPSPDGQAVNFPQYFADEFKEVIAHIGFEPVFYNLSDLYKEGRFNAAIRTALENAAEIRRIYQEVSGSEKPETWLPLQVICPVCGKIGTTEVHDFDGETVGFTCRKDLVKWAEGCGYAGRVSPFDGNGKLVWKVEWAAKWKVVGVDIEGAGKDHSTKGGSRDVARVISEQVFTYPTPFDIPYEFFIVGGKKMSSSKGLGATSREIADLLPGKILRLLMLRKPPKRPIDFEANGDTIPNLFDEYDRLEEVYFGDGEQNADAIAAFKALFSPSELRGLKPLFRPRFRDLAFMVQIPYIDLWEKLNEIKGSPLSAEEKSATERRADFIKKWLDSFADEKYLFRISENLPVDTKNLNETDRRVLTAILAFFEEKEAVSGHDLHGFFHSLKEKLGLEPRAVFAPIYRVFLGREDGPKAGFLLSVLAADFVRGRLREALAS